MLELKGVCKSFSDESTSQFERFTALGPIDLRVERGSFVTLIGVSGCGKTTLLRSISGLTKPSAGRISWDNTSVDGPSPSIMLVPQNYSASLFPWLTVKENIAIGLEYLNLNSAAIERRVKQALETVGLHKDWARYPRELSGGMQQRAAVARALARKPQVLLMDEPYGALDAITKSRLEDELLDIWRRSEPRMTVLFVTHDPEEAIYMADRLLVMKGPPGSLAADIQIQLPRPRQHSTKKSDDFDQYRHQILDALERLK
ncbi:MAG: ABC transporter ATP-binding protein [Acidobacteriota bacterium]|nr:ABC transporter ATP-binding protein [Acidobacteriota bacterium]